MNSFTLESGQIAIGDPHMGLVIIEFQHSGEFILEKGSLKVPINSDRVISLDTPALFVVDAENLNQFEKWYHRVYDEERYDIHLVSERINEISQEIGKNVAFYWEQELSSSAKEGSYMLDISMVKKCE